MRIIFHRYQRTMRIYLYGAIEFLGVYDRVYAALLDVDSYFVQKRDCTGKLGLSTHQKLAAAFRMLAYGVAADALDENLRIGESTAVESMKRFCAGVVTCFMKEYIRLPNEGELRRISAQNAKRGFPGCVGSIDCMRWKWKNCPTAFHGQYIGKEKVPSIVMEGVADEELWFHHVFFGIPGSNNDLNVLDNSPLFNAVAEGKWPPRILFTVNGVQRNLPYLLVDGIYYDWAMLVKSLSEPRTPAQKAFAAAQEAVWKDVERAFGVLQGRFHILSRPSNLWLERDMAAVIHCCVILHNMCVEHPRLASNKGFEDPFFSEVNDEEHFFSLSRCSEQFISGSALRNLSIACDVHEHHSLTQDLIQHIWNRCGRGT